MQGHPQGGTLGCPARDRTELRPLASHIVLNLCRECQDSGKAEADGRGLRGRCGAVCYLRCHTGQPLQRHAGIRIATQAASSACFVPLAGPGDGQSDSHWPRCQLLAAAPSAAKRACEWRARQPALSPRRATLVRWQ